MPDRDTILIVDDDLESLKLLSDMLEAAGYSVRPSDSGELALAFVATSKPKLILLDMRMPGLDGFEVCRRVRASEEGRTIPLMFISAAREVEARVEGLRLGAVDFITKPFQRDELLARVRTHLELGRLRTQLEEQVEQRTAELRAANEQLQRELGERHRAEKALRESEEMMRLAMQAGRTYAFEWDVDTDKVRRSYNCADLLGIGGDATTDTATAFIGRIHPEDRGELLRGIAGLTLANDSFAVECRVQGADGRIAHLHENLRAIFDADGRLIKVIGMVADITRRKEAELALRESEERFRNMADTAPVVLWVTDCDNNMVFCNKHALTFTGCTMEKLAGTGWTEVVHADDAKRLAKTFFSITAARSSFQFEMRLRRADGEYRWVLDTGVPRFLADGSFAGYIGSMIDITELKRNQQRMLEAQKLESLGVLAAGIAHDFNNMIGSIMAESDLALLELDPDCPARQNLDRIGGIAIRASEIVNLIMSYTGGDGSELVFEPVDLSSLAEEMLQLLNLSISKKAKVKTNLCRTLPLVRVNAPQIRQVFMNLITNASEALQDTEGTITVTTSRVRHNGHGSRARASSGLPEGEYVRLEVSDTGCGMSEEVQARAFDPFFSTKFLGRGLGLAAVRGILHSYGGTINVESAPARGARFEVLLPCVRDDSVRNGRVDTPRKISTAGGTMLVQHEDTLKKA